MALEKSVRGGSLLRSRRCRVLLGIFIFIAILAVVIPPAVVITLRKKKSMGPKSKVFVPLYVYPAPGAWTPLEEVYVLPLDHFPRRLPYAYMGIFCSGRLSHVLSRMFSID